MILNGKLFYSSLYDQHMGYLENISLFPIPLVDVESCSQFKTGEEITENWLLFFLISSKSSASIA